MKRGKTFNSFLVFKYRLRSTINTVFEFVNRPCTRDLIVLTQYDKDSNSESWSTSPFIHLQKDKQRSTKHTYKTKDGVTRTPLKTVGELRCSGRVNSSCSNSDTRRVNLVTNPGISHERGKDREVFTTSGTYPWSFVTQIFHNSQPSRGGDRKTFEVMTST